MAPIGRTILVTGGAGFIGSHTVDRLIANGHRVVTLDLLTYAGSLDNLAAARAEARHSFVQGDIADRGLVASLLENHRPDAILNMAAESHVDRSIDSASAFIHTNVTGVLHLLEAARDHWQRLPRSDKDRFRFIQMSTDEVYGSIEDGVFNEFSNYAPNSPYAASKAAGDHLTRSFGITFGLPVVLVHASNTYGPRQHPEKLIPHMTISALAGRPLPVYGQGTNVRDWLNVADLARGLTCVVERGLPGEVYNFAGCDERKNIDTVRILCAELDRQAPKATPHDTAISFVTDRPGHDLRYAMAIDKVERDFGWRPQIRFPDGLRQTLSWYLANRSWWDAILARGHGDRRIGLGVTA